MEETRLLHEWFLELWDNRQDSNGNCYCFETGRKLSREVYRENSCCYSHLLPKARYPEYAMKPWNIAIVHPDAHTAFEMYPDKAPNQLKLKKELLELHR